MASKRAGMQKWKKADGGLLHGTKRRDSIKVSDSDASDAVMQWCNDANNTSDVTSSAETPREMNRTNKNA